MNPTMQRCPRCRGRKKLFKVGGAYSHTNTGGVEVECPMCVGIGNVKKLEEAMKEIEKKRTRKVKATIITNTLEYRPEIETDEAESNNESANET